MTLNPFACRFASACRCVILGALLSANANGDNKLLTKDGYLLAVPPARKPRPLLVCLHGTDEKPNNALRAWMKAASETEVFLLCPAPTGKDWMPAQDHAHILELIEQCRKDYSIDGTRIYLTGFSSGATMASLIGLTGNSGFAAILLNSGHYPKDLKIPNEIKKPAVHVMHGSQDIVFPPDQAKALVASLNRSGFVVSYTEDRLMGHSYLRLGQARQMLAWLMCFRNRD